MRIYWELSSFLQSTFPDKIDLWVLQYIKCYLFQVFKTQIQFIMEYDFHIFITAFYIACDVAGLNNEKTDETDYRLLITLV